MSHFLANALGVDEPRFRQSLMALERRSNHPNHDIRLSSSVLQSVRYKLDQLGLDADDTTAEELYCSLNFKLAEQDKQLNKKLRTLAASKVNAEANIIDGLNILIKDLKLNQECLALKPSLLKKELKLHPPKKVMKALGYRSVDSMLKLEPMPLLLLAINDFESEAYVSNFYAKYKKYQSTCLELRKLSVIMPPKDKKWQKVLKDVKKRTGLTLVSSYELASIIILPTNNQPASGYLTMLLAQLLSEISVIKSASSYLKLNQVKAGFGAKLYQIAEQEPYLESKLLNRPLSFKIAQQVLGGETSEIYGPHVTSDDLKPTNLLTKLGEVIDDFKFWEDSEFLGLVKSAETTSLNILDVSTNLVNNLSFGKRRLDHFRHALNEQLMKLYISPEQVIQSLSEDPSQITNKELADNKAQAVY